MLFGVGYIHAWFISYTGWFGARCGHFTFSSRPRLEKSLLVVVLVFCRFCRGAYSTIYVRMQDILTGVAGLVEQGPARLKMSASLGVVGKRMESGREYPCW